MTRAARPAIWSIRVCVHIAQGMICYRGDGRERANRRPLSLAFRFVDGPRYPAGTAAAAIISFRDGRNEIAGLMHMLSQRQTV